MYFSDLDKMWRLMFQINVASRKSKTNSNSLFKIIRQYYHQCLKLTNSIFYKFKAHMFLTHTFKSILFIQHLAALWGPPPPRPALLLQQIGLNWCLYFDIARRKRQTTFRGKEMCF